MATKPVKRLDEIEQLVLTHLRKRPETSGIRSVRACLHERGGAGSNWSIYRFDAGTSNMQTCQAAILSLTQRLQKDFDATEADAEVENLDLAQGGPV